MAEDLKKEHHIAVSYASEDRKIVEKFVKAAKERSINVYFDQHEKVPDWGTNLSELISEKYGKTSLFCLIFTSKYSLHKEFPKQELDEAQKGNISIIPIKLDETPLPDPIKNTVYETLTGDNIVEVVNKLKEKIDITVTPPQNQAPEKGIKKDNRKNNKKLIVSVLCIFIALFAFYIIRAASPPISPALSR